MAAIQTVPHYPQRSNFDPITPRHGVVTLFGYGIKACVDRGHLIIEDGIGSQRRYARFSRVSHGLRRLVIIGSDGMVSLAALRWLADQDAAFVMLDRLGEVIATVGPVRPSDARLRRAQSLAEHSGTALRIAIELIRQKLLAQERLVRDQFHDVASAETISSQRRALMKASSKEEIRRCEAHAALAYWSAWHELPIVFSASDLRRVPDHWRLFGSRISPLTRSPRLAVNPPNAMLNYLYAILESEARLAIAELGLDPGLGVLHSDTPTRDSLACDLMEPIRPQVDAFLLDWLCREPLQRKWFFEERDGNCRLTGEFAVQLSQTSRLWRQSLAPLAEWIANLLWSGSSKASIDNAPATRLTQCRKREAKGIPTQCLPNLPISSSEHLSNNAPLICATVATLKRFDPIAQARRSATQAKHMQALHNWNPSHLPGWLDEKCYRSKIVPRLESFGVKKIRLAIDVSHRYATLIKRGEKIPHARHWGTLAKLTGVDVNS